MLAIALMGWQSGFAQVAATAPTINVNLDHTHCSLAQTPQSDGRGPGLCIASDGLWVQFSTDIAARRIDLPPAALGVTSLNGKTGDLTVSALPGNPTIAVPATTLASPSIAVSVK